MITDQSAGTLLTKASHDGRTLDSHLQDWSAAYTGISHELPTSAVFLPHPIGLLAFGSDGWPMVSISLEKACSKRCQYNQFFRNARLWRKYLQGTPMIEDVNIDVDEFRFDAQNCRRRTIDDLGDFLRLLINTLSHIREGRPDLQVVDIDSFPDFVQDAKDSSEHLLGWCIRWPAQRHWRRFNRRHGSALLQGVAIIRSNWKSMGDTVRSGC